jgi:hypothetical protein
MTEFSAKVGDVVYPVKYGFNALRLFTKEAGLELKDLESLGERIELDHAILLVWAGMKDGARSQKMEFTLEPDDVADLLDEDNTLLQQCMEFFVASFVKPNATSGTKK